MDVDMFIFHTPPQSLDINIIQRAPPAIHADFYFIVRQHLDVFIGGELTPLIAVDDFRFAVGGNGLGNYRAAPFCGHRIAQTPANDKARIHVYDSEKVHKAV